MARLIKIDDTEERVKPHDEYFTLDEMIALIGGFFEMIQITPSQVLYFNNDIQFPVNTLATNLLHKYRKEHSNLNIAGTALIASLKETGEA